MLRDPVTGALAEGSFALLLQRESDRVRQTSRPACLAYLTFQELPEIRARLGQRAHDVLLAEVVALVRADGRALDEIGFSGGQLALLLPDTASWAAQSRLNRLVGRIHSRTFWVDETAVQLTPAVGFATLALPSTAEACSCGGTVSSSTAFNAADLVFAGSIVRFDGPKPWSRVNADGSISGGLGTEPPVATFEVTQTFRGRASQQIVIVGDGSDCDEPFKLGRRGWFTREVATAV